MGFIEKILLMIFKALGDYLVSKGKLKAEEWKRVQGFTKKAEKYKKEISKPEETLEDRLKSSDDFMR